jgi:hypothetical protein
MDYSYRRYYRSHPEGSYIAFFFFSLGAFFSAMPILTHTKILTQSTCDPDTYGKI